MIWVWLTLLHLLVFFECCWTNEDDDEEFQSLDVVKLASRTYGTELVLLQSAYQDRTYRFEDFFWTGSGDGSDEEDVTVGPEGSSTIYKTKTVISTIYMETPPTAHNASGNHTKCVFNCDGPTKPSDEIAPTPTFQEGNSIDGDDEEADQQFWLLTVLKGDGNDPVITDLKNSLAKLYKTAFQRHQELHLGIMDRHKRAIEEPVNVHIYNVDKIKENGDEKVRVLYHVSIGGRPVPAFTAAEDMTLVSDEEVRQELGVPFAIKAEPYLKEPVPEASLSKAQNTWVVIAVTIVCLLVLLLVVAFLILAFTKRKAASPAVTLEGRRQGLENRKQVFERGVSSHDNEGFEDDDGHAKRKTETPTYINFRNQPSNQTIRSGIANIRPRSTISTSSSSSTSLDISPLMTVRKQRTPPRKPPRPKAALNKTAPINIRKIPPELYDSDSGSSRKDSPDTIVVDNHDPGVVSPKSYLSMPSVRSFPRGSMPEPLNKVLEPVSVLHLDQEEQNEEDEHYKPSLIRHGSVGAVEDPGIIGPVVWDWHCQRLNHGVSVDEGINEMKTGNNISKMRKRFHDLLDDTFSLFGSRRESPVDNSRQPPIEVKSHSAANTRPKEEAQETPQSSLRPRPKTTDPRRAEQAPSPSKSSPRGAWASSAPSPLVRPLSAGPVAPPRVRVNVDHVLAQGNFRPDDPAIPLIKAIKEEIQKCSLPGSTTDLKNA